MPLRHYDNHSGNEPFDDTRKQFGRSFHDRVANQVGVKEPMLTSIEIQGYRRLEHVELDNLGRCNLIVGPVNAGKTSFLESLFLFCSSGNADLLLKILGFRQVDVPSTAPETMRMWLDLTWTTRGGEEDCEPIVLSGLWDGIRREVQLQRALAQDIAAWRSKEGNPGPAITPGGPPGYLIKTTSGDEVSLGAIYEAGGEMSLILNRTPNLKARFMQPQQQKIGRTLAPMWTHAQDRGEADSILDLVRTVAPEVNTLLISADESGQAFMRTNTKDGCHLPLELHGAGLVKVIGIACSVVEARGGLLLIDEIDASLHVAAQLDTIRFLLSAAKKNDTQLFVTTHSLETVDLFLQAASEAGDLFGDTDVLRLIQLRPGRGGAKVSANILTMQEACDLREDAGLDPRLLP